jgi:hypothetical protein
VTADFRFYTGSSMRMTFRSGDCIIFEYVQPVRLKPGDLVVFRAVPDTGIDSVHRVVSVGQDGLDVRGDDNALHSVEQVPFENVLGRVTSVERKGRRLLVAGGISGGIWARLISREGIPRRLLGWSYRLLRRSRVVRLVWRPRIETLKIATDHGSVIRLTSSGKTIGKWCPEREILVLRKPWDLVVSARDCPPQS